MAAFLVNLGWLMIFLLIVGGGILALHYLYINSKYFWKTGIPQECDVVSKTKRRRVYCVDETGSEVDESKCFGLKPTHTLDCSN